MMFIGGYYSNKQCDDGNNNDNDGCSSSCLIESGYECYVDKSTLKSICYMKPLEYNTFSVSTYYDGEYELVSNPVFVL